jgi:hypothetical protein
MKTRMVINLINGGGIVSDWMSGTKEEFTKLMEEDILPNMSTLVYFSIQVEGIDRIVLLNAISDFYMEERDETKF